MIPSLDPLFPALLSEEEQIRTKAYKEIKGLVKGPPCQAQSTLMAAYNFCVSRKVMRDSSKEWIQIKIRKLFSYVEQTAAINVLLGKMSKRAWMQRPRTLDSTAVPVGAPAESVFSGTLKNCGSFDENGRSDSGKSTNEFLNVPGEKSPAGTIVDSMAFPLLVSNMAQDLEFRYQLKQYVSRFQKHSDPTTFSSALKLALTRFVRRSLTKCLWDDVFASFEITDSIRNEMYRLFAEDPQCFHSAVRKQLIPKMEIFFKECPPQYLGSLYQQKSVANTRAYWQVKMSVLHAAVETNNEEYIRAVVNWMPTEKQEEFFSGRESFANPLHFATVCGCAVSLKVLFQVWPLYLQSALIDPDSYGRTVLHLVAFGGKLEILRTLLFYLPQPLIPELYLKKNKNGSLPVLQLVSEEFVDLFYSSCPKDILHDLFSESNFRNSRSTFSQSVGYLSLRALKCMLSFCPPHLFRVQFDTDWTPLHALAFGFHGSETDDTLQIAEFIVNNCPLDLRNRLFETLPSCDGNPFFLAIMQARLRLAEKILELCPEKLKKKLFKNTDWRIYYTDDICIKRYVLKVCPVECKKHLFKLELGKRDMFYESKEAALYLLEEGFEYFGENYIKAVVLHFGLTKEDFSSHRCKTHLYSLFP